MEDNGDENNNEDVDTTVCVDGAEQIILPADVVWCGVVNEEIC